MPLPKEPREALFRRLAASVSPGGTSEARPRATVAPDGGTVTLQDAVFRATHRRSAAYDKTK